MALEVIVLAAGKGTRMRSALPKVLHSIAGKPMLGHVVETVKTLLPAQIHIVVGHGREHIETKFSGQNISWVEQNEQLGTGHAVAQAMPKVDPANTVLIVYGDVPLMAADTLKQLLLPAAEQQLAVLTAELDDPNGYGRIIRQNSCVTGIVEQKDASADQLAIQEVNTGVMAATAERLNRWLPQLRADNAQAEYYLTDIVGMAVNDDVPIFTAHPAQMSEILGVNNRRQLNELERLYQYQLALRLMEQGVSFADARRFDCRGELAVGEDVYIDINCIFSGRVELGNNVSVGPNCVIDNAVIGDNVVIKANTVIDDAVLANDCEVGPFARLRPGTRLADNVRIGNFVEVKNTLLGRGAKANHLAYLGDGEVGINTNIGAGTIFCNYDGVNKYKTRLGDNVFIGSNSTIVAPANIESGAFVGAGSTITNPVPGDNLALGRSRQKNIEGWVKPSKNK